MDDAPETLARYEVEVQGTELFSADTRPLVGPSDVPLIRVVAHGGLACKTWTEGFPEATLRFFIKPEDAPRPTEKLLVTIQRMEVAAEATRRDRVNDWLYERARKPAGALSVSELLEGPAYDTEVKIYGEVSLLGELFCS